MGLDPSPNMVGKGVQFRDLLKRQTHWSKTREGQKEDISPQTGKQIQMGNYKIL